MTDQARVQVSSKADVLSLFEEYMAYMSRFYEIDDYKSWHNGAMRYLDTYDLEANRHIFAYHESDSVIGFAMVNDYLRFNETGRAIAEFYIVDEHKGEGRGGKLADFVFKQFPGKWEVAVAKQNCDAKHFWRRIIKRFSNDKYEEIENNEYAGTGFSFLMPGRT